MNVPSTLRRRGLTAALAAVTVGTTTAVAIPSLAQASDVSTSRVSLTTGHVDVVDIAWEDGEFELAVHDESVTPDVERDPDDVLLVALRGARTTVPDDPAYRFLGAAGSTVSILPQAQNPDLLWPGFSAEEIEPGTFVGDTVEARFTKLSGPDGVSVFTEGADGSPQVVADSEDSTPDVIPLTAGEHFHANVAFEKPGTYRITYQATGVLADTGARVTSAPATLVVSVR
ncbi:MAG: choice-of-anchor M domain-containing protein [Dermatophilaceae bacterium]